MVYRRITVEHIQNEYSLKMLLGLIESNEECQGIEERKEVSVRDNQNLKMEETIIKKSCL